MRQGTAHCGQRINRRGSGPPGRFLRALAGQLEAPVWFERGGIDERRDGRGWTFSTVQPLGASLERDTSAADRPGFRHRAGATARVRAAASRRSRGSAGIVSGDAVA